MFSISKLIMYSMDEQEYVYTFKTGLNYFKGENSTGKTEFYNFIDYMFGSSEDIRSKPWFKDTLLKAKMIFEFNGISYSITRTNNPEQNYLNYSNEQVNNIIDSREYKEKLNSIFTKDVDMLKELRSFTEEELTYRTFTMFNFLGEKRQGAIQDFLDKSNDVRYSIKLVPILNYIFNNHLDKIFALQRELKQLSEEVIKLEALSARFDFVVKQVNRNLQKLDSHILYSGKNVEEVRQELNNIKEMRILFKNKKQKDMAELEVMYSNISEQIKVYENRISDFKQQQKSNENRQLLLNNLDGLLERNTDFEYLVLPLKSLISELDNTISFGKYLISDNTINELKKRRDKLKEEIKKSDSRFKCYTLEEKAKAIVLIEDYISTDIFSCIDEIKEKKNRMRRIRNELKILQNSDDTKTINALSNYITELYKSAKDISSVVIDDLKQQDFKIQYFKKGNILQPTIETTVTNDDDIKIKKRVIYNIGSMARHTLIQLCGYFGFLDLLLKEERYPIIPILVIDHISKPFDINNSKAIGKVISKAFDSIGDKNIQIFMFDNKDYKDLNLSPNYTENLVTAYKSGFNPFFYDKSKNSVVSDSNDF